MATDNSVLNQGSLGDTVRNLARQAGVPKTQVTQLDLGGSASNPEVLLTAGQQAMATSMPVAIASDQAAVPTADVYARAMIDLLAQLLIEQRLTNSVLAITLNLRDDLDLLRADLQSAVAIPNQ